MIAENREDCSFIWENYYDADSGINEYDLTIFVKEPEASSSGEELFSRFQEVHFQRGYTLEEMWSFIERSGLAFVRAFDADTLGAVTGTSERIYCVAQERQKDEKKN